MTPRDDDDWFLYRSITVGALVIAALCTIPGPGTFPGTGIWHFDRLPFDPLWTLGLVCAVAVAMPWIERVYGRRFGTDGGVWPWERWPSWTRPLVLVGGVAAFTAFFFHLASDELFGDAERLIFFINRGMWFHKRAPLSFASFQVANQLVGDAHTGIQLVSSIGGGLAAVSVARFAALLAPGKQALQVAIWAAVLSVGAVILFFGHIEHYALPAGLAMTFMYLGTRALLREESPLPAVIAGGLAAATHLSMLTILPAMAFLCWMRCVRGRSPVAALGRTGLVLAVLLIPATALYYSMQEVGYLCQGEQGFGGGDLRMFVPMWKMSGRAHRYLFLRPDHLMAIANEQLLTAPMALWTSSMFGIAFLWRFARRVLRIGERPQGVEHLPRMGTALFFVLLASSGLFTLTVIWNPDIGPWRDWSLFAPAGLLLSMLAVMLIATHWRKQPARAFACLLLITAVNLHRTLPWLYRNIDL